MKDQLSVLLLELQKTLGKKMIGLLHIGSNERRDETAFSDIDLIILSEKLETADFQGVRDVVKNLNYLIDIPIIMRNQVPANPDLFLMGTHGCYFIKILKQARLLYGLNFFSNYPDPSEEAVRISVFRKIAEYTWASRRTYVESNRERSIYQNYQQSSRLLKVVKDVLWLFKIESAHSLTSTESVCCLEVNNKNLLSEDEWSTLRSIADPDTRNSFAANMSEDFLRVRFSILEKLHSCAVNLLMAPN